jgi:hypothetical protein
MLLPFTSNISLFQNHENLPVGEQGATGHTWQTEEVPNMIIKIQEA